MAAALAPAQGAEGDIAVAVLGSRQAEGKTFVRGLAPGSPEVAAFMRALSREHGAFVTLQSIRRTNRCGWRVDEFEIVVQRAPATLPAAVSGEEACRALAAGPASGAR